MQARRIAEGPMSTLSLELCASIPIRLSTLGAAMGGGGGGVSIDFDQTVLMQMVLFAVLVVVLKPLLFDPMLRVFEQREQRTEGAKADARHMQEEAGVLLRRYERELERVHRVAAEERERLRSETARLEAEILDQARESANRIASEGRRLVEAEVNAIRFELGKQSEVLAEQIASRVLGRGVS